MTNVDWRKNKMTQYITQIIIIACIAIIALTLFGCADPVENKNYIVEPKSWPQTGWYWDESN